MLIKVKVFLVLNCLLTGSLFAGPEAVVDAGTINNKELCGYQGWHRCAGDASGRGWSHWNGDFQTLRQAAGPS